MGLNYPLNNLKGFASSRPPLVVFTLCVTAFALTTLSLAYFIRNSDSVPNPDIGMEWPVFLRQLSKLELCVLTDESVVTSRNPGNISGSPSTTIAYDTEQTSEGYGNVSIVVAASLSLAPQNITQLYGSLPISDLGPSCCMGEADAGLPPGTLLNISVVVPPAAANGSGPHEVCVTFSGPRALLPAAPHSLQACSITAPVGGSGARLVAWSDDVAALGDDWCPGGTQVRLSYRAGPGFSVTLTVRDRSLVNLHLIHTSYFLFVMAMTLICYAIIKGKPKQKTFIIEKVPLDP